jgi:hypothetical protein
VSDNILNWSIGSNIQKYRLNEVRLVVSNTDELVVDVMRDAEGKRLIVSNTDELVVDVTRDAEGNTVRRVTPPSR